MRKIRSIKLIAGAFAIVLGLLLCPQSKVEAASGLTKTVQAGKAVSITTSNNKSFTLNWTAPKTGYFNFEFKNTGAAELPFYNTISVKINGKKDNTRSSYLLTPTKNGFKSMYLNCDKGTKIEIVYKPYYYSPETLSFKFKLNLTVPKRAVGLKNKSMKTATKLKLNEEYTTAAKRDRFYYANSGKYVSYDTIVHSDISEFNKNADKFDMDWYEFTAPRQGAYLFSVPSTVVVYVTDSKGTAYMCGRGNNNNKVKIYENVYLKKGEKAYFVVVPSMLNSKDTTILDGYIYSCRIKYSKQLTELYQ